MKNTNTLFYLLLFIVFSCQSAHAYNLKQIADKEYLSNSSITSLCQDERGTMWIGTCDGLNMYDGQRLEIVTLPDEDDYLSGNLIDNIVCTGDNIYWIQTYYGLNKLDRNTGEITHYNEFRKMFFMNRDNGGTLFIISESNSIYYYHKRSGVFKKLNISGILFSDILSFFIDGTDRMWVVMRDYSHCYDVLTDPESGDISLIPQKSALQYHTPLQYCFYNDGAINYIDGKGHFYSYDTSLNRCDFVQDLSSHLDSQDRISSIVKHHDDFFIGFNVSGVFLLEKQAGEGYAMQKIGINSGVFCLKKDSFQDILWIGTDGEGLFIYSNTRYSVQSVVLNNLTQRIRRPVRALYLDKDRTFWVGTKGDGILKIYHYKDNVSVADCTIEQLTTDNSGLGSNAVYCFAPGSENSLWIGDEEGLNYHSYASDEIRKLDIVLSSGEKFKYIHAIYESPDRELWLASVGMGIVRARVSWRDGVPELRDIRHYTLNNGDFESNYFFTIYPDEKDEILFGNRGYGVFRFNRSTNILEPFTSAKYEKMALNNALAICTDSLRNYWVGTSFGLLKNNPGEPYTLYNVKDGFLNNTIHAILKESPTQLWLSTNQGLICFDTEREIFRSYGFSEGLSVIEFSDGAAYRDEESGTLFFGGINGFVSVRKDSGTDQLYMPPICLSKLAIFGIQQNLQEFLAQKKENEVIRLKHNQNIFSVSFSAIDYLNGNNYSYYYKIEEGGNHWVNNGTNNTISFTNMPSGDYTVRIKYKNGVFGQESPVHTIRIEIAQPWYLSGWAYGAYTAVLLAVVLLFIRSYRLRNKRKKQEMLHEIEKQHQKNVFESKLRFFTNIAHEFCTPLTLIYGPCSRILSLQGLNAFVADYVRMIQVNAERLNNLIHELIEFRRIETGNRELHIEELDISGTIRGIVENFAEAAKSKEITIMDNIPDHIRWNTDKGFLNTIVINLVSNAFKYAPAGKRIRVEVALRDGSLVIEVANEGSTIKEKDFKHIFNRYTILDNFEKQDERNVSRNGLGLAISHNMATLLNGNIEVANLPENWVLFTVTLPRLEVTVSEGAVKNYSEYIPNIETRSVITLPKYEYNKMRPTMLVIDDEPEMLRFIGDLFMNEFNIVPLQDPARLEQVLDEVYPNIIISDIKMPGTNGIEITQRIKSMKETAHIPIVIVSGMQEEDQQIAALSAGAEMYISKPFNPEYLRISVFQIIERQEILKSYFSSAISSFEKSEGKLTHKESKKFLQSVLKIINDHITDKDLSPRFIADQLAISPRSLYRKLEDIGEESPTNMIKEFRLHMAKDLLVSSKKTIDEIVFESGFSNKVTFFKAFKMKYGCTPKEYRNKQLDEIK